MTEKKAEVIEAVGLDVPPQIINEHLMTEEESAAAHQKVEEWYLLRKRNAEQGDK